MSAELIAVVVDKGISITGAIVALLYGYRLIGKRPGVTKAYDEKFETWGKRLRVCGWLMLVCFVPLLIVDVVRVMKK